MTTKPFRTIILLISLSIFTILVHAQNKYQGLLWEITGNGLKKPSYLYGTMHVSNKIAFHLTDTFFVGIKNCEKVALEINPETLLQDLMSTPMLAHSLQWSGYNQGNFYKNAFAAIPPDNKTIGAILAKEESFVNYLLYRSVSQKENFEENTYLDLFIFQSGKKLGKQIIGLENVAETIELSIKASIPDEDDMERADYGSALVNRNIYEEIEDAYRKGNLDLIDSLSKLSNSKKFTEYMLYQRNVMMAQKMDSIMQKTSLFTGIGAAHLPGDKGVINLLRAKGYTVRSVSNTFKSSNKEKDKIENSICKISGNTFFSDDSLFQINIPGQVISRLEKDNSYGSIMGNSAKASCKEYFYPEMANGAYYSITRIKTFAPLVNQSSDYMMKRIDSLLYENIPGKILKKKIITINGLYGYDIINKTRRGDIQRYHIVVTPLEIIILKLSGIGEFVPKEGDKFFSSAKVNCDLSGSWKNYTPMSGGFSIAMPGAMSIENNSGLNRGSAAEYTIQSQDQDGNYYLLIKANYNDLSYIEEDTFELNILAKNFYKQFNYSSVNEKFLQVNGYPAKDLLLKKDGEKNLQTRVIIEGPNYYLIAVKSNDQNIRDKFLNSFSIKTNKYSKPFEEYKDTSLYFSVKTPVKPSSELNYRNLYSFNKSNHKMNESYLGFNRQTRFVSSETAEVIEVDLTKYHELKSFTNEKEFWDERIKALEDGSLISKKLASNNPNEVNLLLTDTNSTRAIKVKMILKGGALYTIAANVDTIGKESEFINTFFQSFKPSDTTLGKSLFENKGDKFFEAFSKDDSLLISEAMSSLDYIKFENRHAEQIIKLLKTYDFSKISIAPEAEKAQLIRELGYIKDKKTISFLKELYLNAGDTSDYQLAALKALAGQKTPEAFNCIISLLKTDAPLTSEYEINSLFAFFKDSLRLAANLYPDLLEFTRFPEYKANTYELLAILVDSNYIDPQKFLSYKQEIIREAKEELKRRSFIDNSSDNYDYSEEEDYDYDDYNGGSYQKTTNINDNLLVYATLLMPYYEDQNVKQFYSKLSKTKYEDLLLNTSILLKKNKKDVPDSIWNKFAKDDSYRINLYNRLKDINHLENFDKKYQTQEFITRGLLYENSASKEGDSILFIEKREIKINGKNGFVYFYKRKNKDSKSWKLDYTGLQSLDSSKFEVTSLIQKKGIKITSYGELNKLIEEKMEELALTGRKRAKNYYSSFNDYYDE